MSSRRLMIASVVWRSMASIVPIVWHQLYGTDTSGIASTYIHHMALTVVSEFNLVLPRIQISTIQLQLHKTCCSNRCMARVILNACSYTLHPSFVFPPFLIQPACTQVERARMVAFYLCWRTLHSEPTHPAWIFTIIERAVFVSWLPE